METNGLTGQVLRCKTLAHYPYRANPKEPGFTRMEYTANKNTRGRVFHVLVLGESSDKEDPTNAELLDVMTQLGWKPEEGHPILEGEG